MLDILYSIKHGNQKHVRIWNKIWNTKILTHPLFIEKLKWKLSNKNSYNHHGYNKNVFDKIRLYYERNIQNRLSNNLISKTQFNNLFKLLTDTIIDTQPDFDSFIDHFWYTPQVIYEAIGNKK